jgi:hypothetical protein
MTILPGFFDAGLRATRRWSLAFGVGSLTTIMWIFLIVRGHLALAGRRRRGVCSGERSSSPSRIWRRFLSVRGSAETIMPIETSQAPARTSDVWRWASLIIDAVGLIPFLGALVQCGVVINGESERSCWGFTINRAGPPPLSQSLKSSGRQRSARCRSVSSARSWKPVASACRHSETAARAPKHCR